MKIPATFSALAALSLLPLTVSAQVATPATPAAASPAKKMPLSSADKQLVKNAGEAQLTLLHLAAMMQGPTPKGSPAVLALAGATKKGLNEAWGEVGSLAIGEMPKTDQTPAEKKEIGELNKMAPDKFDKAYLKAYTRESKRANAAFTSGSKFAGDTNLKAFFVKWQPIVAKLDADAIAADADTKKK